MRYGQLAGVAKPISLICLGTGPFGSQTDEPAARRLLDSFVEHGGTFIDSAHIYGAWDDTGANGGCGNSEVVIGRWMQERGCREELVIGTKGGHPDFKTAESALTPDGLRTQLRESLEHLQTDYVDIYWLHRDDRSIPAAEILSWLKEPLASGVIRTLAFSNWRTDRIAEAGRAAEALGLPAPQASQIAWSLAGARNAVTQNRFGETLAMDEDTWAFHAETQTPIAAFSSQARGFFAAKYDDLDFHADDFPKPGLARGYGSDVNLVRRQSARELGVQKSCSTNQIALAWMLHQPFPVFPIVGPNTTEQLADSVAATDVELTETEVQQLHHPLPSA
jgi:aryl-alcohol dehydrogenase-like predicted oxidoreductase